MVFGEIVEPSTRALLIEDDADYCIDYECGLNYDKNFILPGIVNNLIVCQTKSLTDLIQKCMSELELYNSIKDSGLSIYYIGSDNYLFACDRTLESNGPLTEVLTPWLAKADNVKIILCDHMGSLLNKIEDRSLCVMRQLTTGHNIRKKYPTLEQPNMVRGLGANIFSFRGHIDKSCELYLGYVDSVPLDSENSKPFIELLTSFNVGTIKNYTMEFKMSNSNLYM